MLIIYKYIPSDCFLTFNDFHQKYRTLLIADIETYYDFFNDFSTFFLPGEINRNEKKIVKLYNEIKRNNI